jgi:hypothetical protein
LIDFRYHLVSIVSIFLALAVGIVLGAGPLQGEIGSTLNKEVSGLRQDKADLNDQLDAAQAGIEGRDGYLTATSPIVLAGALPERTVALVVLPGADAGVADATAATLGTAGARVVSTTTMTEEWVTPDNAKAAVRDAVVQRVAGSTGVDISDTGSKAPRDVLLATLLARPTGADAAAMTPEAALGGLRALADGGLLSIDTDQFQRAQLVVVASGAVTSGDTAARTDAAGRWVDLSIALDDGSDGTVMAAALSREGDGVSVLETLRNDATAVRSVSGVDDADDPMGQASVVHALVQQDAGATGQYGLAAGAEAPFAPLPTPSPTS